MYTVIPLRDFSGQKLVYLENVTKVGMGALKLLLSPQSSAAAFGIKAMEDEIHSTLIIENIEINVKIIYNESNVIFIIVSINSKALMMEYKLNKIKGRGIN